MDIDTLPTRTSSNEQIQKPSHQSLPSAQDSFAPFTSIPFKLSTTMDNAEEQLPSSRPG
eukprot:gene39757-52467_t